MYLLQLFRTSVLLHMYLTVMSIRLQLSLNISPSSRLLSPPRPSFRRCCSCRVIPRSFASVSAAKPWIATIGGDRPYCGCLATFRLLRQPWLQASPSLLSPLGAHLHPGQSLQAFHRPVSRLSESAPLGNVAWLCNRLDQCEAHLAKLHPMIECFNRIAVSTSSAVCPMRMIYSLVA
jgi:hypothetical protein